MFFAKKVRLKGFICKKQLKNYRISTLCAFTFKSAQK